MMQYALGLGALVSLFLSACTHRPPPEILGTVEWDHIELLAESAEPVIGVEVHEGQQVRQGDVLIRLNSDRARANVDQLDAEVSRWQALLDAQQHGNRTEAIAQARAQLRQAEVLTARAVQELKRAETLRQAHWFSDSELNRMQTELASAKAQQQAAQAALDLMLAGTRVEDITQTEAALSAAKAKRQAAFITLQRHTLRAPRAGYVDAIPVEVGGDVKPGDELISLLVGNQPYARVFVSEGIRTQLKTGDPFTVHVQGSDQVYKGQLRHVQREANFTPYYALTGDDASRLVYVAEIELLGQAAAQLPAGIPLRANWLGENSP